jgi:hypothetical protein
MDFDHIARQSVAKLRGEAEEVSRKVAFGVVLGGARMSEARRGR